MKRFNKSGFTLAELMIVLVVMGVLAAVLLPVANNSRPDENVLKFKKANGTIGNVVRELVTSSQYFGADLNTKAGGAASDGNYFCKAIADILSVKSEACKAKTVSTSYGTANAKGTFDSHCANAASTVGAEIVSADGVVWYQGSPAATFPTGKDGNGFYNNYKVFCIDVDGIGKGIAPFGYGIRLDGKMMSGARADSWMNCPETKKKDRPAICKQ